MSATNLPPEIIEAILPLLPAKSLGRFKSVSKTWNSLISNPQFIKTHLRQTINHHKTTKFIFFSDTISLYSLDINQLLTDDLSTTPRELSSRTPPITWARIIGSCNGLVLAQEDETDAIFILNPTTKQLHKVPSSPFTQPDEESSDMYGFGYDSSTDDYKVVSISFWDDYPDIFVCVYSLLNNSWRKLHNFPYNVVVHTLMNGILVNENLHWLARTNLEHPPQLVAFNLATEEFNEVKLPDDDKFKFMFKELVAVGGKLCLVDAQMVNSIFWVVGGNIGVCNIGQIDDTDLWIMEEYGVCDSWTKVCIHGVEIDPVCLVDGSNREIVLCDEQEVVVYNTKERRCENVRGLSGVLAVEGTYFESLESPKRISRAP